MRKDDWKLVIPENGKPAELYNLKWDPIEKKNLVQEHPDILLQLQGLFKKEMAKDA